VAAVAALLEARSAVPSPDHLGLIWAHLVAVRALASVYSAVLDKVKNGLGCSNLTGRVATVPTARIRNATFNTKLQST